MQMGTILKELEVSGDCLKQFARFGENADTRHLNGLAALLKAFSEEYEDTDPPNFTFEEFGIRALTLRAAEDGDDLEKDAKRIADVIGMAFSHLVWHVFHPTGDVEGEPELLSEFLRRATRGRTLLDVMREFVFEKDKAMFAAAAKEPAAPLTNPSETPKSAEPAAPNLDPDNLSESLDAADCADLTALVKRWERLGGRDSVSQLVVLDDSEDDDVKLTRPEFRAAIDAINRVRHAANAECAAPEGTGTLNKVEEEEAKPISETDNLERKFQELKAEGGPMDWLSLFVTNSDSIDLTEAEFREALRTITQMREGSHLAIPDKAAIDSAIGLIMSLASLGLRAERRLKAAKEAQPQTT